nr:MAG TPA: hypothetical protein [Caudoviricetes sp.]
MFSFLLVFCFLFAVLSKSDFDYIGLYNRCIL